MTLNKFSLKKQLINPETKEITESTESKYQNCKSS